MTSPTSIIDVDATTFDAEVLAASHDQPVLVDFWAGWCEPCGQLSPVLEEIVSQHADRMRLAKVDVDVDGSKELAARYQVQGIPHILAIRDGQVLGRFTGVHSTPWIERFVERFL